MGCGPQPSKDNLRLNALMIRLFKRVYSLRRFSFSVRWLNGPMVKSYGSVTGNVAKAGVGFFVVSFIIITWIFSPLHSTSVFHCQVAQALVHRKDVLLDERLGSTFVLYRGSRIDGTSKNFSRAIDTTKKSAQMARRQNETFFCHTKMAQRVCDMYFPCRQNLGSH